MDKNYYIWSRNVYNFMILAYTWPMWSLYGMDQILYKFYQTWYNLYDNNNTWNQCGQRIAPTKILQRRQSFRWLMLCLDLRGKDGETSGSMEGGYKRLKTAKESGRQRHRHRLLHIIEVLRHSRVSKKLTGIEINGDRFIAADCQIAIYLPNFAKIEPQLLLN